MPTALSTLVKFTWVIVVLCFASSSPASDAGDGGGTPTGACCFNGQCVPNVTQDDCVSEGGQYLGDGSVCPIAAGGGGEFGNLVYGIDDRNEEDTQLFIFNLETGELTILGDEHDGLDLEGFTRFNGTFAGVAGEGDDDGHTVVELDFGNGDVTELAEIDFDESTEVTGMTATAGIAAGGGRDGVRWAFLEEIGFISVELDGSWALLIETSKNIRGIAASPDGTKLYGITEGGRIYEVDVDTGEITELVDLDDLLDHDDGDIENLETVGPTGIGCFLHDDGDLLFVVIDVVTLEVEVTNYGDDVDLEDVESFVFEAKFGCPDPICGPGAGSCLEPNGTPGCDDVECCETVCAGDPFCCDVEWDQPCANAANDVCVDSPCPGEGDCCEPNGTPGCEVQGCCEIVCRLDPFCCDIEWDGICADEAADVCDIDCGGPSGCCGGDEQPEDEACGDDTNGGCNATPPAFVNVECGGTFCGTAWADGGSRDTDWYLLNLGGPGVGDTTISATLESVHQSLCFIVGGIESCAPVVLGDIGCSVDCQTTQVASAVVDGGGLYVVFVSTGNCDGSGIFEGVPCNLNPEYRLTIECGGGGDCPGDGDCCIDNGTPGCEDVECCDLICGQDPFCCDTSWDGICADAAADQCEVCTGGGPVCPGEGGCCQPNDSPGCEDPECCTVVCRIEPLCCEISWSQECAGLAEQLCEGCLPCGSNDDCSGAIEIFDGDTPFSNEGATTDGPPLPELCNEGFGVGLGSDIWYVYNPVCDGVLAVSTCDQADYDTRLAAYTGGCDDLTLVACNDDGDGCAGFTSSMEVPVTCGVPTLLRVGGFGDPGAQGSGTLTVGMTCFGGCPLCPGDTNGDMAVDVLDLVNVVLYWGTDGVATGIFADVDGSGTVDVADVTTVILNWGDC